MSNVVLPNDTIKRISNKHKRYLLVTSSVYGSEFINPTVDDDVNEKDNEASFRMYLPRIDSLTSLRKDKDDLLMEFGLCDYKVQQDVDIKYKSNGEVKSMPVMYDDKELYEIAIFSDRTNKVAITPYAEVIFSTGVDKLKVNKDNLLYRLLNSNFCITDPKIRKELQTIEGHGSSGYDFNKLYGMIHGHYKQWRAFYYHTSDHYKKDILIKQKKV